MATTDSTSADTTRSSNETDSVEAVVYIEATVAKGLWVYGAPLIIILGTIGNALALVVLTRKNMRKSTSSVYLSVLAVVDTIVLYTGLLRHWIGHISDTDIRNLTIGGCKFHVFLVYFSLDLSAWILVAVTFERLVAVYIPHKAKVYCTNFTTVVSLCSISSVLFFINLHFFWTYGDTKMNTHGDWIVTCYIADDKYKNFIRHTWTWIDMCIASFVPFIIMFVSNVLIIGKVRKLSSTNESKMTTMTAMLLTVNFVFIICTAPIVIYLNHYTVWYPDGNDGLTSARQILHYAISSLLMYTNSAINFLLYCVSGPKFRRELTRIVCRKKNQVAPLSRFHHQTDEDTFQ